MLATLLLLLLLLPLLILLLVLLFKLLLVVGLVKAVDVAVLLEGEAVEGLLLRLVFVRLVKALAGETPAMLEEGKLVDEVEEVAAVGPMGGFVFLPPPCL